MADPKMIAALLVAPLIIYLAAVLSAMYRYSYTYGHFRTREDALRALTRIVRTLAQESVEASCKRCLMPLVGPGHELTQDFIAAVHERGRKLRFSLKIYDPPPAPLQQLADEGLLTIQRLQNPPRFSVWIVDGHHVFRHEPNEPELYESGSYVEARNAPEVAADLKALAA